MRAALLASLLLARCASSIPMPEIVNVPVPVNCIDALPVRPKFYTDAELKAMNDYQLPLALAIDRVQRHLYETKLEAALAGCWQPVAGGI